MKIEGSAISEWKYLLFVGQYKLWKNLIKDRQSKHSGYQACLFN